MGKAACKLSNSSLFGKSLQYGVDFPLTHSSQHDYPDQLLFTRIGIACFPVINRLCCDPEKNSDRFGCQSEPVP